MVIPILVAVIIITFINDYTIYRLWSLAAQERKHLEDRLIALTDKDASILLTAKEEPQPGTVTYIDEAREYELSNSAN